MTIEKNNWADIQDGVTQGLAAAELVNDSKRAVNEVIDVLNGNLPEFPQQAGDLDISIRAGQLILSRKAPDGTVVELNGGNIEELRNWSPKTLAEWLNNRTLYVGSVAELQGLPSPIDGQQALVMGSTFEYVAANTRWEPRSPVPIEAFGAKGDGTDDRQAFRAAFNLMHTLGGGEIFCDPTKTYSVSSPTRPNLNIGEGTTLDLRGSTIQRIAGSPKNVPIIETRSNIKYCAVKNGTILGTGSDGSVSDQGSAILFLDVADALCENIVTDNTDGDGIQGRRAGVTIRNVRVKRFGRNGISPTSGNYVYDNVVVEGPAFTGADPGIGLDAENNTADELGIHKMYWLDVPDLTFVDFYRASGDSFGHEVDFIAGRVRGGSSARHLRFLASNDLIAEHIVIGPGVTIDRASASAGVEIENVSGIRLDGTTIRKRNTALTTNVNAISLVGTVRSLFLNGVKFIKDTDGSDFNSSIFSLEPTNAISGISMIGCGDAPRLFLTNTTDSFFSGGFSSVRLSGTNNSGIIFAADYDIESLALTGGATTDAIIYGGTRGGSSKFFQICKEKSTSNIGKYICSFPDKYLWRIGHCNSADFTQRKK